MDSNKGLVSVVITTHNRTELLKRAIESVVKQTYNLIELIVIDDAPLNSDTAKLCDGYNLIYYQIDLKDSRGGNYARNVGIKLTKGEFVAFLDDDDFWESTKIEKQIKIARESNCGIVYCGCVIERVLKDGTVTLYEKKINKRLEGDLKRRILMTIITTTSSLFVKKELLQAVGCFDEELKFWQEYELTIRLAQVSDIALCPECLLYYRINPFDRQRLTNKYKEWKKAANYVFHKHKKLYDECSWWYRILCRTLFYRDAVKRSYSVGEYVDTIRYLLLSVIFYLPFYIYDKINSNNYKIR